MLNKFILLISTFFLSYFAIYFSIPLFNKILIDNPNKRSSHTKAKPRGGGIYFVIITIIFGLFNNYYLPLFCLPVAIVGLLDDFFNLKSLIRIQVHAFTAFLIIIKSNFFSNFLDNSMILKLIIFLVLLFLITGLINLVNFMDGIDGLVSSSFILVFFVLALIMNYPLWPLIGSLFGFLLWNWYPSKIFMGDVGSTFLGAIMGGIILNSYQTLESFWILLTISPLLLDSSICILRRLFVGSNIFSAHNLHLYQRLNKSGWNHAKITIFYLLMTSFLLFSFSVKSLFILFISLVITIILGLILDKKFAMPFKLSLKKSNK